MKNILLAALLLLFSASAFAQAPTTQEEYNYVTKGLAIQRSSGLDMKAGYLLLNRKGFKTGELTVITEDLVRTSDKSVAATVITVQTTPDKVFLYLCSPNTAAMKADGSSLHQQFWASINKIASITVVRAIADALALRLAEVNSVSKQ